MSEFWGTVAAGTQRVAPLLDAYRRRVVSPVEVVRSALAEIERHQPSVNAFITVTADSAIAAAEAVEQSIMRGDPLPPLAGVPIAVKDALDTQNIRTTVGSRILGSHIPAADALAVAKLVAAGAVMIGKTNLDEFCLGGSTENAFYGPTLNPLNSRYEPGGSSGGSAAAVAAGMCAVAIGSDTGGSIRAPATACGLVGVKPTWGRVPTAGLFPLAWSMDTIGPLTASVNDARLVLSVLSSTTPFDAARPRARSPRPVGGLRIGVDVPNWPDSDSWPREDVASAASRLSSHGAEVRYVRLPSPAAAQEIFQTLVWSEAARVHARWLAERGQDYGDIVREKLEHGRRVAPRRLAEALLGRATVATKIERLFSEFDALLIPAAPVTTPIRGGDRTRDSALAPRAHFAYFPGFNLSGHPAMVIPTSRQTDGLRGSIQLVGRRWEEETMLTIASVCEARDESRPYSAKAPH